MNLRGGVIVAAHVWRALVHVARSAVAGLLQLQLLLLLLVLLKLRHSQPLQDCMNMNICSWKCMYYREPLDFFLVLLVSVQKIGQRRTLSLWNL